MRQNIQNQVEEFCLRRRSSSRFNRPLQVLRQLGGFAFKLGGFGFKLLLFAAELLFFGLKLLLFTVRL